MKILYIHNEYGALSGEEHASRELVGLLQEHGHEVRWFTRSSEEIVDMATKIKAFFTGIYNPCSAKKLDKVLDEYKPDVVQVQNLYPFLSSSIFKPLRKRNIPVVMRCPNYRLFCPSGLCLGRDGEVCEKCFGGKEWHCVANNCEQSISKSLGYAARNAYSRCSGNIMNGVDVFITQSEFQKKKFIEQGIEADRIGILPGICPALKGYEDSPIGDYVTFVGRVSREKGIYEFIEAARATPSIPFKVAGKLDSNFVMPDNIPANLEFLGFVGGEDLNKLYVDSRIIVVPSKWYEGFPNVITRGMLLQRPVITTNIGAMQSIIDHKVNGMLIPPGDAMAMISAILSLYQDKNLCIKYGKEGFKKASEQYSREAIYDRLMEIYQNAINRHK